MPVTPLDIRAEVRVAATPREVWAVLSDVRRMPEFSPELRRVLTTGSPGVGTRIVGINRRGLLTWPTVSHVVRWEPERAVAWKVRESGATWLYEVAADDTEGGATVLSARRILPRFTAGTSLLGPLIGGAAGHDRELEAGLRTTLERMRAVIERGSAGPGRAGSPAVSAVGEHGGVSHGIVGGSV